MRRLIDHNPFTGITTWHEYDATTDTTIIHSEADVEPLLEQNKALYNQDDQGWSPSREWRRAADIPLAIAHKWLVEDGIDIFRTEHWPAVKRKLNSNEWLYLRTAPGRL